MSTTTEAAATIDHVRQGEALTAADLRQMADLLDLVGQTVVKVDPEGHRMIGTLETVYVTDGIAVNIHGLIDWAANGKDYGRDFSMGPLYGATVEALPDPWIGFKNGLAVGVFPNQAKADVVLESRTWVDSVAPYHQEPR